MQIGDFHASKCPSGYLVMEVITQGGRLNNQRSSTVGVLKGRDSAVDAISELARRDATLTVLTVGPGPLGPEIRATVDGGFTWSRVCKDARELRDQLARARLHEEFLAAGWTEITAPQA